MTSKEIEPLPIDIKPWQCSGPADTAWGQSQWVYRFDNGYGASVIDGKGGALADASENSYELIVIAFAPESDNWVFTYLTPVAEGAVGWQSLDDIAGLLVQIEALPPDPEAYEDAQEDGASPEDGEPEDSDPEDGEGEPSESEGQGEGDPGQGKESDDKGEGGKGPYILHPDAFKPKKKH